MGISHVYSTDISPEMVKATEDNTRELCAQMKVVSNVALLDAKNIASFPKIKEVTHIATEGYLGRIFGQHSIRPDLVEEEKRNLLDIY